MSLQSDLNNVKQKEDEKIDEKTKSEITTSSSSTINTKKEKFSTSLIKPQEKKPDDTFVTRNFPAIVGWISILLSIAECGVLIFEYLFINTIFHSLFRALAPYLVNTDQAESRLRINLSALDSQARGSLFSQLIFFTLTALKQDFSYIFCSIVCIFVWVYIVCYYFFWRYGITPKREKHFKMFDLSSTGKFTLQIILSGFACMVLIQMFSPGPRIFSLDNFFVFNEKRDVILAINYPKIGQILIGTPIIEEIVLRFIMTTVMVKKFAFSFSIFSSKFQNSQFQKQLQLPSNLKSFDQIQKRNLFNLHDKYRIFNSSFRQCFRSSNKSLHNLPSNLCNHRRNLLLHSFHSHRKHSGMHHSSCNEQRHCNLLSRDTRSQKDLSFLLGNCNPFNPYLRELACQGYCRN